MDVNIDYNRLNYQCIEYTSIPYLFIYYSSKIYTTQCICINIYLHHLHLFNCRRCHLLFWKGGNLINFQLKSHLLHVFMIAMQNLKYMRIQMGLITFRNMDIKLYWNHSIHIHVQIWEGYTSICIVNCIFLHYANWLITNKQKNRFDVEIITSNEINNVSFGFINLNDNKTYIQIYTNRTWKFINW